MAEFVIKRTDASDPDFIALVKLLDTYLTVLDGEEHAFYGALNQTTSIRNVVVVYNNNEPVGCGAFKPFDENSVEIKRMFTQPAYRGQRIATLVLQELEIWANELGFGYCVLETGQRQPAAISLYKKLGYTSIPNYGHYKGIENSICFRKSIKA